MNILLVAATRLEIAPIREQFIEAGFVDHEDYIANEAHTIKCLVTGIGLIDTTYHLTTALKNEEFDYVINVGIAGSFRKELPIGSVVQVVQEEIGDLGLETPRGFVTVFDANFADQNQFPFSNGRLELPESTPRLNLPQVHAVTANSSHGTNESIEKIKVKFDPDIESMEGAAFFYVCLREQIPFVQLRGISNYVEPRNTENWDVPLALRNLTKEILTFAENSLSEKN